MMTQVLTKNVRCGSLWDSIKNFFKKAKDFGQKTMNFIDSNPLTSTLKDVAFDYVQNKTGVDPSMYYDTTKTLLNNDSKTNITNLTNAATKTLTDTYQKYKNKPKNTASTTGSKKQQLATFMKDLGNNLIKELPKESTTIQRNVDLFASGLNELSSGSINLDVWKRKGPLFLLAETNQKASGMVDVKVPERLKDFIKNRFKISDVRLPPTMKKLLLTSKAPAVSAAPSSGRLHLGNGDNEGCGKKTNEKYAKLLASLK
jgi:ribosome-associated translation inhibitor RaiA